MDKQTAVYLYNRHLLSSKKKSTTDPYNKMVEYPKHFSGEMKRKKSDTKDYMLFDAIHMTF